MLKQTTSYFVALLASLVFAITAAAQVTLPGKAVDVVDGKTVVVDLPNGRISVELQYIDVPEAGQALSETVKSHLRSLVVGKTVEYRPKTLLRERTIGRLIVGGVDVSQQMLRDGAAWHIPLQVSGQEKGEFDVYDSSETSARNDKLGIWSIAGLRPSWELRAEAAAITRKEQQVSYREPGPDRSSSPRSAPKRSANANPALGDIGALANGFDPVSGTGFLGTSFLPVGLVNNVGPVPDKMMVDITYYYKQDARGLRKGSFVFTLIALSNRELFSKQNELKVLGETTNIIVGKPRRTVKKQDGLFFEELICEVKREALEKFLERNGVRFVIAEHYFEPSDGFKLLLYNLLETSR